MNDQICENGMVQLYEYKKANRSIANNFSLFILFISNHKRAF
jgi:hypothetical protein